MRSLKASEIKVIDRFTIEEVGIPSMVLMERAALAVSEKLQKYYPESAFLIFCGTGNNGGDGLALARILHQANRQVEVVLIGDFPHASEETTAQLKIIRALNIPERESCSADEVESGRIIIDALFGIGLNRAIENPYLEAVCAINSSGAEVVALDIPSGLEADTGQVFNEAVNANRTLTIGFQKKGFERKEASQWTGKIEQLDIGYPSQSLLLKVLEKE